MNDINGQPLTVGDRVAFPDGAALRRGVIIRVGKKMAIVSDNYMEYRRYFCDLMKVPE